MKQTTLLVCLVLILLSVTLIDASTRGRRSKKALKSVQYGASNHANPYHVSFVQDRKNYPYCGGSIISKHLVLTSAHCIFENSVGLDIVAGIGDYSVKSDTEQTRKIKAVITHPKYKWYLHRDSLALVLVDSPFDFNENVKAIKLSSDKKYPTGSVTVTGHKTECNDDSYNLKENILRKADFNVLSYKNCKSTFNKYMNFPEAGLCYTAPEGNPCLSELGSPVVQKVDGNFIQTGVLVFIHNKCGNELPPTALRVSEYSEWIEEVKAKLLKKSKKKSKKHYKNYRL